MGSIKGKIFKPEDSGYLIISVIIFKLLTFYYFHNQFQQLFPAMESWLAITPDTSAYYDPIKNWVNGQGYGRACRMPGLLPIYAPLYYFFGELWSNNAIVIIQLISSTSSVILLAKVSKYYFPKVSSLIIIILYLSTPFISIYDHYGLSDSFSVSWMIFGCYFFIQHKMNSEYKQKYIYIILSAFFFIWASYFRQLNLFIFGMFGLLLFYEWIIGINKVRPFLFAYSITAILLLSPWWVYNLKNDRPTSIFVESIDKCFDGYPEHQIELRKLPMAWGGKFMVWGKEAEWFLRNTMNESEFPFSNDILTSQYNLDSLKILRKISLELYYEKTKMDIDTFKLKEQYVINKSRKYIASYKKEQPFDYYIFNKLKLFKKFLISKEVVLPYPNLKKMNIWQKIIKVFALLTTSLILILGLFKSLYGSTARQRFLSAIIWLYVFIIVVYMGFIEYRYWETIFPLIVMFCASLVQQLNNFFKHLLQKNKIFI